MTTRTSTSEPRKAKKLTLKKGTVRDLTIRRAAGVVGGLLPPGSKSYNACSY